MRLLLGAGAIGETVKQIQRALTRSGFDTHGCDGWYGPATAKCVEAFQEQKNCPITGAIDEVTWGMLMGCAAPSVSERCLQLTAAFEGHGFGHAVGNFDGALLTWGIVGFTLASGGIQSIVRAVNSSKPELLEGTFGDKCCELLELISAPRDAQTQWANQHTHRTGALAEPWCSLFATLGSLPEVQREQLRLVEEKYMAPAIHTAKRLGFSSELGLALCFDIHVQNGGIKQTALDQIRQKLAAKLSEPELRATVANAVADAASPLWRDDVRQRKLTIAHGEGTVHGHHYVLMNWGLSGEFDAPEMVAPIALGAD